MNIADNNILISTIVLNWNRADLLRKTIQSYLATVSVNYELIICDNNSHDESREFIKTICADNPNHHAILLDENYGGEAFNFAMKQARGRYFHFSENDLEYLSGWDKELLSKFTVFPNLGQLSLFSPFHEVEKGEIWTDKAAIKEERNGSSVYWAVDNVGTSSIVKRELWEKGVRWKACGNKTYWAPDDGVYSTDVKNIGYGVAWNDKYVVFNWGHNIREMTKRLDYYLNNAEGKENLGMKGLMDAFCDHGYTVKIREENTFTIKQYQAPTQSRAFARRELWKEWMCTLSKAQQDLSKILPERSKFALIDDDHFGSGIFPKRNCLPFPEVDNQYMGAPSDSIAAIQELERQRQAGTEYLVIIWPSFWWLDHYDGFRDFLNSNFSCMFNNDRLIIFNLNEPLINTSESCLISSSQAIDPNQISAWFYKMNDGINNFGDLLGKYIVEKLSGKVVRYTRIETGEPVLVTVGSVLNSGTGIHKNCTVWGSGIMRRNDIIPKDVKICAVRGPVTQERLKELGIEAPTAYGDPALLLNRLYQPPKSNQTHELGIVPHYVDFKEVKSKTLDKCIKIVDLITDDVERVINEITACKYIISSSLHGVIVAHTYGIPAIWVRFSNRLAGDNVKFEDYFTSVGIEPYEGKDFSERDINNKDSIEIVESYGANNSIVTFNQDQLLKSCPFWDKNIDLLRSNWENRIGSSSISD